MQLLCRMLKALETVRMSKKIYGIFRDSLTFSHSCQSFNNFYTVILAPMVYLSTFVIWNNIFVFTAVVSISVKAIMTCYCRYFVGTRN